MSGVLRAMKEVAAGRGPSALISPRSKPITGDMGDWEGWMEIQFREGGSHVVPGALNPVEMDGEGDPGTYEGPDVRMRHPVGAGR